LQRSASRAASDGLFLLGLFVREFGTMGFDYARANPSYGLIFNKAMSSMSSLTTDWTVTALAASTIGRQLSLKIA
jgi:hypothetical protein